MAATPNKGVVAMFFFLFFFLVDSWAVSTENSPTRFVIVMTFDIPNDFDALQDVVKAIQTADLPHRGHTIHLATDDVADRVLAEFNKDET